MLKYPYLSPGEYTRGKRFFAVNPSPPRIHGGLNVRFQNTFYGCLLSGMEIFSTVRIDSKSHRKPPLPETDGLICAGGLGAADASVRWIADGGICRAWPNPR